MNMCNSFGVGNKAYDLMNFTDNRRWIRSVNTCLHAFVLPQSLGQFVNYLNHLVLHIRKIRNLYIITRIRILLYSPIYKSLDKRYVVIN